MLLATVFRSSRCSLALSHCSLHCSLLVFYPFHNSKMKLSSVALALFSLGSATAANPFAATSKNDAKAKYMSNLMRGAKATPNSQLNRRLDQAEEYIPDISTYAVKFEQCQFVKTYSDEVAEDEDQLTVLDTQRFVIFRLCPTENSYGGTQTCGSCNYNYGEYLVDLEQYLEATVQYYQEEQENMCQACEEACQQDDANQNQDNGDDGGRRRKLQDCSTCTDECYKIENMEANGYIDATEFLECQMIYDPEDDGSGDIALYAGPMCASDGTKIKIGVFEDEYCSVHDSSKEVDSYLVDGDGVQMKLSHALLKNTYSTEQCISCLVVEEEENGRKLDQQEAEITECCQMLYEDAAKCEKTHGFDNGYANYDGYENQLAQEEIVCDFMSSLMSGTYDEDGEIRVNGSNVMAGGGSSTTGGQKFALAFFIIGTVGLAAYAAVLRSKLTKGGKADLSRQGGAMA